MNESRESNETENTEFSPQDSVSTGDAILIVDSPSFRASEYSPTEVSARRGTVRAKSGHNDDRFKDNPLGEGCWRWFCIDSSHRISKVSHSEEEPSNTTLEVSNFSKHVDKPNHCAPGFGHNGVCDTPGMTLLRNGVRAARKIARRRPTLETTELDVLRSGFKLVRSRYRAFRGQGTMQSKG